MKSERLKKSCRLAQSAFTLIELLVASFVIATVLVGMMRVMIYCASLSEVARHLTAAVTAGQDKLEEIRNHNYNNIAVDYASGGTPGNKITLTQPTGKGRITVNAANANLLQVDVVVCWKEKDNRIIGEDLDLDGDLDVGEDVNGNNALDSMVHLSTLVANK